MFLRMTWIVCAALCVCGCASTARQKAAEPHSSAVVPSAAPYQQEQYVSEEYSYDDTLRHERYEPQVSRPRSTASPRLSAKQIQRALKAAGYYKGSIDGKIGPQTKAAVRSFQKSHGLKVDGIVGRRTQAALQRYL